MQVVCPNCGETFEVQVDPTETEFIIDCEVCCRPMTVRVVDGGSVDVSPA